MRIKRVFTILFVILFGISVFIFLRSSNVLPNGDKLKPRTPDGPVSTLDKAARVALHPLAADWKTVEAAMKQRVLSWEDWARKTVEIGCAMDVLYGHINTPEEVAADLEKQLAIQLKWAANCESRGSILPNYPFEIPKVSPKKRFDYEGPQTSEALLAAFDPKWMERYPQSVDWNAHYPKAAWIDRIVSLGGEVQSYGDYSFYLKLRRDLIKHQESPHKWHSGAFGIPPTTNFEEYETGYINRKIWENDIRKEVRSNYPDEPKITTYFPSDQPDKYLPVVGNMTYVYRKPNSSVIRTYGKSLTDEEVKDLRNKGIEPKGLEIIYIDDEYNVLTEKPKPYNHQEWLEKNSYDIVPEGLRAPDGTIVSPERYQEIRGQEMPYETRQRYDEYIGDSPAAVDPAAAEAERRAVLTREAARAEFERFKEDMRQIEKFQSMAANEVSREFALEFLSQYTPKSSADKRLQTALQTMFQRGFDDGLHSLRKDDPALAAELERYLAETHRPPQPQLRRLKTVPPKTVPPNPAETPPAGDTD